MQRTGDPANPHFDPIAIWSPACFDPLSVEHWRNGAKLESTQRTVRLMGTHQLEHQRRQQRSVHDESRIALFLRRICAVVMNSMAVEGERRISEKARRIERPLPSPFRIVRRGLHGWRAARRCLPIHDVLLLAYGHARLPVDLVFDRHEAQVSGPAALFLHSEYSRNAPGRLAQYERREKFEAATGPHPTRQLHRRHEITPPRVPIRTQLARRCGLQKIGPLPSGGQRCPLLRDRLGRIQSCMHRSCTPRIHPTGRLSRTTDPVREVGHFTSPNSLRIAPVCSPSSGIAPYSGQLAAHIG